MAERMKVGAKYTGPMAIFDGEEVDRLHGFYALTKDGKSLLKQNGKPVRLMHVDRAPEDPDDGSQEFRVAGKDDPPSRRGNVVGFESNSAGQAEAGS